MKVLSVWPFVRRVWLLLLLACSSALASQAQCVDSSEVNNFKVRSVQFRTLFGRVPKQLQTTLDSHRGEPYSAAQALKYIHEIRRFYAEDPAQEKYERLIANKVKLSVKAGRTDLECVKKVDPDECESAFPGTSQCVDVAIRRYFVDVDALDSSPYLLLFPRSFLTALYGAMPRPLLALNPAIDGDQDSRFGPALSVDTVTDLLDVKSVFGGEQATATALPGAAPTPTVISDDDLDIDLTGGGRSSGVSEEPDVQLPKREKKLLLRLKGRKSLTEAYYDTSTGLTFARTDALSLFQNLAIQARYDARNVPEGNGDLLRNAGYFGLHADLRFKKSPIRLINFGGEYRWSRNRFYSGNANEPPEITSEHGFESRVVMDGSLAKGLTRVVGWFDGGSLNQGLGSYKRAGVLAGYGKEFVIRRKRDFHEINPPELRGSCWTSLPDLKPNEARKNEQTIGVEILAGAGRAWGNTPEYARFFAGSPSGQFLYDELSAINFSTFPPGPIVRSLAQSQVGLPVGPQNSQRGGTSYWHANISASLPIAGFSRPLIPYEWVTASAIRDDDTEFQGKVPPGAEICRDIKSTIKTRVRVSGVNLLVNQQARDMLTEGEKRDLRLANKPDRTAEEEARFVAARAKLDSAKLTVRPEVEALFNTEILPVTDFIADHANILAVKPLFVVDVASLGLPGGFSQTRFGAGGGLQIDVVMARFELGYIAGLNRAPADPRGHFFGRLILRRFF